MNIPISVALKIFANIGCLDLRLPWVFLGTLPETAQSKFGITYVCDDYYFYAMPRVKQFNEEEVLKKAMEVFWKKGFYATSMQELVDGMGINRASLYDTFGDKEALFNRAFKLYQQENQKRVQDFLFSIRPVQAGVLHLFEQAIDTALRDPDAKGCFVVNATTEMITRDCAMHTLLTQNRLDFEQVFYEYLQEGVSYGEISPDKDLRSIAALIFTLYNGVMVLSKINRDKAELMNAVRTGLKILEG